MRERLMSPELRETLLGLWLFLSIGILLLLALLFVVHRHRKARKKEPQRYSKSLANRFNKRSPRSKKVES